MNMKKVDYYTICNNEAFTVDHIGPDITILLKCVEIGMDDETYYPHISEDISIDDLNEFDYEIVLVKNGTFMIDDMITAYYNRENSDTIPSLNLKHHLLICGSFTAMIGTESDIWYIVKCNGKNNYSIIDYSWGASIFSKEEMVAIIKRYI